MKGDIETIAPQLSFTIMDIAQFLPHVLFYSHSDHGQQGPREALETRDPAGCPRRSPHLLALEVDLLEFGIAITKVQ